MEFSIVLPAYNVGKYIERCLISCVNQTYPDFEVVVVDDCGEDDSIQKANRFAQRDPRIKVVSNDRNMGTYHARRLGASKASGKYVLFLDPDDELELDALKVISVAAANNVEVVLYGIDQIPKKRFYQKKPVVPKLGGNESRSAATNKIVSTRGFNFGTAGKVYRHDVLRSAYQRLNIPEYERHVYSEDSLLFASVMMGLKSAVSVTDRLYVNHKNPSSITMATDASATASKIEGLTKSIRWIRKFEEENEFDQRLKKNMLRLFEGNRARLLLKEEDSFFKSLGYYGYIVFVGGSLRDVFKFLVCMLTLSKLKL